MGDGCRRGVRRGERARARRGKLGAPARPCLFTSARAARAVGRGIRRNKGRVGWEMWWTRRFAEGGRAGCGGRRGGRGERARRGRLSRRSRTVLLILSAQRLRKARGKRPGRSLAEVPAVGPLLGWGTLGDVTWVLPPAHRQLRHTGSCGAAALLLPPAQEDFTATYKEDNLSYNSGRACAPRVHGSGARTTDARFVRSCPAASCVLRSFVLESCETLSSLRGVAIMRAASQSHEVVGWRVRGVALCTHEAAELGFEVDGLELAEGRAPRESTISCAAGKKPWFIAHCVSQRSSSVYSGQRQQSAPASSHLCKAGRWALLRSRHLLQALHAHRRRS